jgi:hypothetical protein
VVDRDDLGYLAAVSAVAAAKPTVIGVVIRDRSSIELAARLAVAGISTALVLPEHLSPTREFGATEVARLVATAGISARQIIPSAADHLRELFASRLLGIKATRSWWEALSIETARAYRVAALPRGNMG